MKEKIIKILYNELTNVYCDTCRFQKEGPSVWEREGYDESPCNECYRKCMRWEISEKQAEKIAEMILNEIK
jgi:NAD-dependent SIR2 family protein deacetylase